MLADQSVLRGYTIEGHRFSAREIAGGLHVVATPIGNLGDITIRALQTLSAADVIYCEDTRVSSRLLARYEINTTLKPYHDHNAAKQRPLILAALRDGAAIALISDAGTPLVSDPGYKLVSECREEGIAVDAVPGASAALAALALAGLPSDQFRFCGFAPVKAGARKALLEDIAGAGVTAIVYESPRRLVALLEDMAAVMPASEVAVCRELTKLHQEVVRGTPAELAVVFGERDGVKGEVTLVISPGAAVAPDIDSAEVAAELRAALADMAPGKAAGQVARRFGLKKGDVYGLAMGFKDVGEGDDG